MNFDCLVLKYLKSVHDRTSACWAGISHLSMVWVHNLQQFACFHGRNIKIYSRLPRQTTHELIFCDCSGSSSPTPDLTERLIIEESSNEIVFVNERLIESKNSHGLYIPVISFSLQIFLYSMQGFIQVFLGRHFLRLQPA